MGILDGLLGMFGGQQQPQGGLLGTGGGNSLYGDLLTPQQQQALQQRASQGGLLALANSGALDYTVPFISGKVPGGAAKGLAAYAGGMGEGEDKGILNALNAQLAGLKGLDLKSQLAIRRSMLDDLDKLVSGGGGPGPNTGGPPITPPGDGPLAGGALTGSMRSDNPGSLAMAESPEIQEAVAKKLATTDGVQHWANFNPALKSALSDAGLPTSGPVSEEQWARVSPLIKQYESNGGQNIPNYRFDSTHTAGGTHQITNSTWRAIGGPEIAAQMRGASGGGQQAAASGDAGGDMLAPTAENYPNVSGGLLGTLAKVLAARGAGPADTVAPQVRGTGAPITQAQLGGQPGLLSPPAPQAVSPITMPQQPTMPQPGAGASPRVGGIDPLALAKLGVKAQLGGIGDVFKPLSSYYYQSPQYLQQAEGAKREGQSAVDLRYAAPTAQAKAAGERSITEPSDIRIKQAEQTAVGNREMTVAGAAPQKVGETENVVYPTGTPGAQNFQNARLRGESVPDNVQFMPDGSVRVGASNQGTFGKEVAQVNAKDFFARRSVALDAQKSLEGSAEARKLLDNGIITGAAANLKLAFGKALQGVGFQYKEDPVANTEAYTAARAMEVGRLIKQFGSGTGLSDADRQYAAKMAGGEITLNEASIRRILDISDRASRNVIQQHNKDASLIDPKLSPFPLTVEAPAPYQKSETQAAPSAVGTFNGKTHYKIGDKWYQAQ